LPFDAIDGCPAGARADEALAAIQRALASQPAAAE
jgi:hypothetical protein